MRSNDLKGNMPRSKLSNAAFIKWVRTRFRNQGRRNNQYLYFPQELIQEMSIEKIFVEFDADQSGGLSRDEVFDMFNSFGIKITMDDLNQLYDSVEVNLEELNCEKFKKCALSVESNRVFRSIVAKLGQGYYPHNFTNMIIYIVFLSKRDELRKDLEQDSIPIDSKVQKIDSLLKLNDLSLNNQRLSNQTEHLKHNIKSVLRDIWNQTNDKWGNQFPFTPALEEEFYQFCTQQQQ